MYIEKREENFKCSNTERKKSQEKIVMIKKEEKKNPMENNEPHPTK